MKELKDADSWDYRGEGNANIVFEYRGDDPELIGKVLRLRKCMKDGGSEGNVVKSEPILSIEEQKVWADWPDLGAATTIAELNHVYVRDVLRKLLGDNHVDPGTLVYFGVSFIESLYQHLAKRPTWRAMSSSLEAQSGIGLLISDHTGFKRAAGIAEESPATISVELKPKCGFLPTTPLIRQDSVKKSSSRFTMHQRLKFHQGKIERISKYDPLDLFSGTRDGIMKAMGALFETPQNNLRIFVNGEEIFGASTCDKLSMARFDNLLEGFVYAQPGGRVQEFQELVAELLLQSDILSKLLAAQKLDYHGIEGARQAYNKFSSCHARLDESSTTRESTENLRQFQEENTSGENTLQLCEDQSILSSASLEDCGKILRDFLISATAKDCGLMLSLQPWEKKVEYSGLRQPGETFRAQLFRSQYGDYLQKVLLLDLDVKRLKKMSYYWKLDQEIVQSYQSSTSQQ